MESQLTKWILVAGTGKYNLSEAEFLISIAIGTAIAKENFGLVVGGWAGVDYVVAESFAKEMKSQGKPLSENLIQVVSNKKEPEFKGGYIINVDAGLKEWTEAVKYADAVVLIGGLGGTYESYLYATEEQKPVFPIAGTEGDARKVLNDIVNHAAGETIQGVAREEYIKMLQRPILSESDAVNLIHELFGTLKKILTKEEGGIFISYSHRDKKWLDKLRMMLKPLERRKYNIWDDRAIEAGDDWNEEISKALTATKIAIFLVSPNFIASDYIHKNELPPLLEGAQKRGTKIIWILVSACLYDETGLQPVQAAHDVSRPLDTLRPARQNEVLVEIARKIISAVEEVL
jgi:predicted Rossmann-fold nucleotide-binding protein